MLLVPERRRGSRAPRRDPRSRCSRRRYAGGADETRHRKKLIRNPFVSLDPTKTAADSEHRSDQDCAPLPGRMSEQPASASSRQLAICWLRASEEGSGLQAQSSASGASNKARSEPLDTASPGERNNQVAQSATSAEET
jgi:hypothetical protein